MAINKMIRYALIFVIVILAITAAQNTAAQQKILFFDGELISAPKNGMYDIPYLNGNKQEYVFLGQRIPQNSKYLGEGEPKAKIIEGKVTTNCYKAALRLEICDPETGITSTIITDLPASFLPECEIRVLEFLNSDFPEVQKAVKEQHERSGIR